MHERTRRSPARFLAPLALAAFAVAFLLVVSGSDGDGDAEPARGDRAAETTAAPEREAETGGEGATARPRRGRATYTVKTGDTLGSIAEQTGVPLERLQELNPELDPQAMVAGQRIKLRE